MTMNLQEVKSWDEIFEKLTVPEIRQLRVGLDSQASGKGVELRALIGGRYKDLLATADKISEMNTIGIKEDNELSELCRMQRYKLWDSGVSNALKFESPRKEKLEKRAVKELIRKTSLFIRIELDNPSSLVLIARCFNLLELLGSQHHATLKNRFEQILTNKFEQGQTIESLDLFTAHAIFNRLKPEQVLMEFFQSRKNKIHQLVRSGTVEGLVNSLQLTSSTFYISEQAFGRNQLQRLITQQSDVYSLLDSPEFVDRVELDTAKYHKWLPDAVKNARSIPPVCATGKTDKKTFYAKQALFGHESAKILLDNLGELFASLTTLDSLVGLYRQILEQLRDTKVLRTLRTEDNGEYFTTMLREKWVDRFQSIVCESTSSLREVSNVIKDCGSKDSVETTNIFAPDSQFNHLALSEANLDKFHNLLADFSNGSVGSVQNVANAFDKWSQQIAGVHQQIDEARKLKGWVSVVYREDDYDQEDDEDWKSREEEAIDKNCNKFEESVKQEVVKCHEDLLHIIQSLDTTSASNVVFKIRTILQLDHHVGGDSLNEKSKAPLDNAYDELCTKLPLEMYEYSYESVKPDQEESQPEEVDAEQNDQDKQNDQEGETQQDNQDGETQQDDQDGEKEQDQQDQSGDVQQVQPIQQIPKPTSPSMPLLAYLAQLIKTLTDTIGHDHLIWSYKPGLDKLRHQVCTQLEEVLDSKQPDDEIGKLQLDLDKSYTKMLLEGNDGDQAPHVKESIQKTRSLYLPLAL